MAILEFLLPSYLPQKLMGHFKVFLEQVTRQTYQHRRQFGIHYLVTRCIVLATLLALDAGLLPSVISCDYLFLTHARSQLPNSRPLWLTVLAHCFTRVVWRIKAHQDVSGHHLNRTYCLLMFTLLPVYLTRRTHSLLVAFSPWEWEVRL